MIHLGNRSVSLFLIQSIVRSRKVSNILNKKINEFLECFYRIGKNPMQCNFELFLEMPEINQKMKNN